MHRRRHPPLAPTKLRRGCLFSDKTRGAIGGTRVSPRRAIWALYCNLCRRDGPRNLFQKALISSAPTSSCIMKIYDFRDLRIWTGLSNLSPVVMSQRKISAAKNRRRGGVNVARLQAPISGDKCDTLLDTASDSRVWFFWLFRRPSRDLHFVIENRPTPARASSPRDKAFSEWNFRGPSRKNLKIKPAGKFDNERFNTTQFQI
jgi:hypothetical protein